MSIVHYMQTTIYCSFRFIRLQKSAGNLFRYRRTVRLSADSHFSQMKVVCKTVSYVRHYSFSQNGTNPVIFVSVPFPLYSRIRYSHAPLWSDIFPALILPFTGKKEAHRLRGVPVTDSSFLLSLTDQYRGYNPFVRSFLPDFRFLHNITTAVTPKTANSNSLNRFPFIHPSPA